MSTKAKIGVVAVLAGLVVGAVALKHKNVPTASTEATLAAATPPASTPGATAGTSRKLPRLLDLGAGKCIPCKMMMPIIEQLKADFAGKLKVEFIDVWKDPEAGRTYGIEMIPTQIFYDATGKELYRHVGFFSREDILKKWKELGVDLTSH